MGGGCFLEMRWFQRAILQKGLRPVSVYQALMLALAFATFIVALQSFINAEDKEVTKTRYDRLMKSNNYLGLHTAN